MKHSESKRTRNTALEQSGNYGIHSNRHRDSRLASKWKKKDVQDPDSSELQEEPGQVTHPFKGKHIDYSL